MRSLKFLFVILTGLALVGGFFVWRAYGRAKEVLPSKSEAKLETLSNDEGGVVTTAAPTLAQDFWSFEIVLDTHSVELDADLQALAFLVDKDGKEYQAISWEGDPPGGHHRKGTLKFKALSLKPAALMLKIRNIGSVPERNFEWKLL